ncbi:unnamed protein product (macronuclear) [Paramecium tetraurelia]|uniref:Uncharacterized protein n=1 Tax=Paramecium tetraurelia TaxID=5888 RepID=A0CAM8_PARTE|nr:uncharacterized protein GSPATT00036626001 [Paramecium tetraurelia]CAK67845.1 unnamed protein product [Paramecium tetraurelia]|eukprot:XP_001435242.1 hypothetical protein (macronuclear) [Paramecium tetraurelia strain d4-2]
MTFQLPHNFQNRSVQKIVQELMYDEYLDRDNLLRNAFISSPVKSGKKKLSISKHRYNHFLQQSPSQLQSPGLLSNQQRVVGSIALQKKKNSVPLNVSVNQLLENNASPLNNPNAKVSKRSKDQKPKELRGLSISDHVARQRFVFPQVQRLSQVKQQQLASPNFNFIDEDFEGYKLKSEEMSLEIDEYVRMQRHHNNPTLLPNIYSRNQ